MTETDPPAPPTAWRDLLDGMADYLAYCRETGEVWIPASYGETGEKTAGSAPLDGGPAEPGPPADAAAGLEAVARDVASCRRCPLCESRTRTVPGQGAPDAELMFVGEGPGADEDRQGLAFVGAAGRLLTKMIEAMGYRREDVFIANIVKCRPPGNRTPLPDEAAACLPYLERQIELVRPAVIIALGATPLKALLDNPRASITRMRGTWTAFRGIAMMPTYHPAYLLRRPEAKRDAWDDLKQVMARLERPVPGP